MTVLALLAIGIAASLESISLGLGSLRSPGPGLWPFGVSAVLTVVSATLLFMDRPEDYEPWSRNVRRVALGAMVLVIFVLLFQAVGIILSSAAVFLAWFRFLGNETWRWSALLAIGGSVALTLIFVEGLGLSLPRDVVYVLIGAVT